MASTISAGTTSGTAIAITGDTSGALALLTNNGTTAVTIDTSQNVGIGTTPVSYALEVVRTTAAAARSAVVSQNLTATGSAAFHLGTDAGVNVGNIICFGSTHGTKPNLMQIGTETANALTFQTNGTERMRLDSNGNLTIGKTTTSPTTAGIVLGKIGDSSFTRADSTNGDVTLYVYSTGASAARFYVGMGGTVFATSTTISAISDQRLKENIQDIDIGLDAVMALKPRKFDWKDGKGKNIKGDRGWVAQEFETIFPEMVNEWADPAPEGEAPYKSVAADLIPVLVKAIQEQQALITDLTTRLTALENK